ncbi:fixH family protein [Methyloversatilis sp. RAC08]|uniref:FixH family protein n=1 Tax=Methyloversatilis sp. RAC08 TaxID=1842540 RepID=UPI00083D6073|nr:FixH family protein [Methyloversatilis sp. RAC08]AOF81157.1 fixH family protein [Methyloversatilis sp. RAC08]
MSDNSTLQLPWYRHRWPWLLMLGPVTVIVAGVITTWLAATGNTALVADDYYKQGLTINRTLERERRADELGVKVAITALPQGEGSGDGTMRLDVRLSMTDPAKLPGRLRIFLAHPTRSELDRELLLDGVGGLYSGVVQDLAPTHWKLVIEDDVRDWRRQDSLLLDAGKNRG